MPSTRPDNADVSKVHSAVTEYIENALICKKESKPTFPADQYIADTLAKGTSKLQYCTNRSWFKSDNIDICLCTCSSEGKRDPSIMCQFVFVGDSDRFVDDTDAAVRHAKCVTQYLTAFDGANGGRGDHDIVTDTGLKIIQSKSNDGRRPSEKDCFSAYYQALVDHITYHSADNSDHKSADNSDYDSFNYAVNRLQKCVYNIHRYMPILKGIARVNWSPGRLVCFARDPTLRAVDGDEPGHITIHMIIKRGHYDIQEFVSTDRHIWISTENNGSITMQAGYYSLPYRHRRSHTVKEEITVNAKELELTLTTFIHRVMSIPYTTFNYSRSEFEEIENKVDKLLRFNNQQFEGL
jgi:hypothetical protein